MTRNYFMFPLLLSVLLLFTASGQERGPGGVGDVPSASAPGSRVALVLGNAKYAEDPLKNTVNDATDMAKALNECGFHVFLETDRDFKGMMAAIDQFTAAIPESGTALFYYTGHAIQVEGENYLIPLGAQLKVAADAAFACVNVDQLLRRIEAGNPLVKIIILDAPRNSPFTHELSRSSGEPTVGQDLAPMIPTAGTIIVYAQPTGHLEVDQDRNSLFAAELLARIRTPGLSIQDLFTVVRVAVGEKSNKLQMPWQSDGVILEFCFQPRMEGEDTTEVQNATKK